jgi:hypothetical protein
VSQDGREYYAVSKTFNLKKKRGIEIKRSAELRITHYGEKTSGKKNSGYRKTCSNPDMESLFTKIDIVNTDAEQWSRSG